jgi:hypothetical protein
MAEPRTTRGGPREASTSRTTESTNMDSEAVHPNSDISVQAPALEKPEETTPTQSHATERDSNEDRIEQLNAGTTRKQNPDKDNPTTDGTVQAPASPQPETRDEQALTQQQRRDRVSNDVGRIEAPNPTQNVVRGTAVQEEQKQAQREAETRASEEASHKLARRDSPPEQTQAEETQSQKPVSDHAEMRKRVSKIINRNLANLENTLAQTAGFSNYLADAKKRMDTGAALNQVQVEALAAICKIHAAALQAQSVIMLCSLFIAGPDDGE